MLLDQLYEALHSFTRRSVADYSTLETTHGNRTFVFRNGAMATVIRYGGVRRTVGESETLFIVNEMVSTLNSFFASGAHEVQMVLNRDLMPVERIVKRLAPMYESARKMGFDDAVRDIFDEQAQTMASKTMDDTIALVLLTNPMALRKEDYDAWVQTLVAERRKGTIHVPEGTQDETYAIDPLAALHDAFVDQVISSLTDPAMGALCTPLLIDEASNYIARFIDPLGTTKEWKAWLLPTSDSHLARKLHSQSIVMVPSRAVKQANPTTLRVANTAIHFPPPLKEQLLPHEGSYHKGSGYFEYGGRLYATLTMTVPPKKMVRASQLIYVLSTMQTRTGDGTQRVPYRLSMRLRGNGLKLVNLRAMWAPLFSVGSAKNVKLMRAYKALTEEHNADMSVAAYSLSLTTWVDADDPAGVQILKSRVVAIRSASSQWGDMQIVEDTLDRAGAFVNSCPCITLDPCSVEGVGTLKDLLPLFPWGRPASPLGEHGIELYRSLDGAILPTEAHSTQQDYWLETVTSPMGGGKSAGSNRKHLDYVFAPGRTSLPYLHILDIGGSVSGLVELLQDALPDDRKHLCFLHTLRNTRDDAVNMLDTKLGLRQPLEGDMQATVDWLTALVTPAERTKPYDNMSEFVRVVLKATYKRFDDSLDQQPRIYKPGFEKIDAALAEARLDIEPGTSWYAVSDRLGARGFIQAAIMAHRKAVPLLTDVHSIAQEDNIRSDFMRAMTEQSVPIPDAFVTQLGLARESFPIFTEETVLDLRGRRITAIDLGEVARKGSASARKQASLMYMVAYELFSRNIRLTTDDLVYFPKPWIPYYQDLLEELVNTHKHITIDEYHRTMVQETTDGSVEAHDSQGLRATLVREGGRESRKWGMSVTTISQEAADHGQLLSLASSNHILKRGSPKETKFQAAALGLSQTDITALQVFVNGPRSGEGVTFMSQWTTKDGSFTQLFTSTIGPKTLWSLSTTFEDKVLRRYLFDAIGRTAGRAALAKHYPGGTAKDEIERRKRASTESTGGEDVVEGACRQLANELITLYRTNPDNYT